MRRWLVFGVVAPLLAGCHSDIESRQLDIPDGHLIIAGPGSRIISERNRFSDRANVLCTEPSPDVAVALASSGNATISGGGGGANASLGGGFTSTETVTKLDGRTAGVVALRDGLYYACQGYANGVLGVNSYALILSEYSVLLGELLSSPEAKPQGAAAPPPKAAPPPVTTGQKLPPRNAQIDRAMLVSCIAAGDPTRIDFDKKNTFLDDSCGPFMTALMADSSLGTGPGAAGPRGRR